MDDASAPIPAAASASQAIERAPAPHRTAVLRVLLTIVALVGLWWGSSYVLAYTDDAFLTSDLVAVAPEVTGPVVSVQVHDNQMLRAGMPLLSIDPTPFQLAVDQARAAVAQAEAQLPVDGAQLAAALAERQDARAGASLADDTQRRDRALVASHDISQQTLDDATAAQREAFDRVEAAAATVLRVQQTMRLHQSAVMVARTALASAQWRLDRTDLRAAVDGPVANLDVRRGDMARAAQPLLGIVDAHAWRIEANYKESMLRHLEPGHRAWVWLDARPWHLYRARIQGLSHAIGREQQERALLPYISPTVDWIRLERRIPVRIELDEPPPQAAMFMGSDARVLVFY